MQRLVLLALILVAMLVYWQRNLLFNFGPNEGARAFSVPPPMEEGFVAMPLPCDSSACRFRLRLVWYQWCRPGDFDTIRKSLASGTGPSEVLLSLESLDPARPLAKPVLARLSFENLQKGADVEMAVPWKDTEGEFGLYLCRDWEKKGSCGLKKAIDPGFIHRYSGRSREGLNPKIPDSTFVFQYLFLSGREKKSWSYSGNGIQDHGESLSRFLASKRRAAFLHPAEPIAFKAATTLARRIQSMPMRYMNGNYVMLLSGYEGYGCGMK